MNFEKHPGAYYIAPNQLAETCLRGVSNDEYFDLTRLFADTRQTRIFGVGLISMLARDKHVTTSQLRGSLHFMSMIRCADQIIDSAPDTSTLTTGDEVRDYLLSQNATVGNTVVPMEHVVESAIRLLPQDQQEPAVEFLGSICEVHANGGGKGKPGEYGFDDVIAYRNKTNMPVMRAARIFLHLEDSIPEQLLDEMEDVGKGLQMLDDALDWVQDWNEGSLNAWIGMACDQNVIHILEKQHANVKNRLSVIRSLRAPELDVLRTRYRNEMRSSVRNAHNPRAKTVRLSSNALLWKPGARTEAV